MSGQFFEGIFKKFRRKLPNNCQENCRIILKVIAEKRFRRSRREKIPETYCRLSQRILEKLKKKQYESQIKRN